MGISWSQTNSFTCPQCGAVFEADIWLIIDIGERPDLLERIRNHSLHDFTCPICNRPVARVDVPLLFYHPGIASPLLYSPAQQTTTKENEELAIGLVDILRERLGENWKDVWLEQELAVVPRSLLYTVLSDDPETAMPQTAEQ